MSIVNKKFSQTIIYSALKKAVEQYGTFHSENNRVNIIGIRGLQAEEASNNKYKLNSHDLWFNPNRYPFHLGFKAKVLKDYLGSPSKKILDIEVSCLSITNNAIWPEFITVYINGKEKKAKIINQSTLRFDPPIDFKVVKNSEIIFYGYQADSYDDTIAVAYKKNDKLMVKLYKATTERGDDEKRTSYKSYYSVILSDSFQYEYRLGLKHQNSYYALKPKNSQMGGYKWKSQEPVCDTERSDILKDGINIHYGENIDPSTWSLGCQVIHNKNNFKDFMKFFGYKNIDNGTKLKDDEIDIDKVKDNSHPYYTLINVKDFEKNLRQLFFPLYKKNKITKDNKEHYYQNNLESLNYFPITAYGWWHNGVHISGKTNDKIQAIADGKIVYVSISREHDNKYGSPNFILLKHEMTIDDKKIIFYSKYMHLHEVNIKKELTGNEQIPDWIKNKFYYGEIDAGFNGFVAKTYENDDGSKSLTLFKKSNDKSEHIEELKEGDKFEILQKPQGSFVRVKTSQRNEGYLYYKNNSISICKKLHKWAIDNDQIKDGIFKEPRGFTEPVSVCAGDVIGYMGEGIEHHRNYCLIPANN
ncbi:hypothetical protein MHK_003595 [Candidatus Magnetomorum sp. HK-1]|nr:hypothetical protein MHK_003595 [Candidatus Magnetomorum sp. HK-1]